MKSSPFAKFKEFPNMETATPILEMLKQYHLPIRVIQNRATFDGVLGVEHPERVELQIQLNHFEKAREIIENEMILPVYATQKDYYLFNFSDDELYEVLLKSDEWGEFDYVLAKKILQDRGRTIDEDFLEVHQKQRLKDLAQPDTSSSTFVPAGYIFALLGGFLGILIGWMLWTQTKILPNGHRIPMYSEEDRRHGKIIFGIGIVILLTSLILEFIIL